uniref:zinc finger protein 184-like isoform X2 n=1 Tax=Gasterosteus aculeatus aculeatus TaxID=481459 RepID=UPI001A99C9A4|nr:zinc finger protein 184-like isoform X2 [Gasterosteus aculeatus aculeatus]
MELRTEAEVQQLLVVKEEHEWSPSLDQEEPEPPHIKEEELQGLEEADMKVSFTVVKSEGDEEEAQSSQLHQRQTEPMETKGDGEDCGGPEPERNSSPDTETSDFESQPDKDWKDPVRKAFSCSVCAKTFKRRGNLNIHMRTHVGVKPFGCSLCSKRFTQKAGLDYHLKIHTGEKPFSCSLCGKSFRHKGALTSHMARHSEVKPFSCGICNKRFGTESQLQVHKCVGERPRFLRGRAGRCGEPLSCSECDATFPNNYLLMTHERMHRGKKLFTCGVCGQKRQFSSHLAIHMRTHTGEKPFRCSVCGKRFSQRGIMSQHMAVHSGVKPFSCAVCGRRFFWHFQIKKHKCLEELCRFKGAVFNGGDCDREEAAGSSDPVRLPKPGTNKDTKPSSVEDSVDVEFWTETRKHQSGFTYQRNRKVSVNDGFKSSKTPFSCSDNRTEAEPTADDGGHGPKPLKGEQVFVGDPGFNSNMKPSSFSDRHRRSEDGLTLLTHGNSPVGGKPFGCLFCGKGSAMAGYLSRPIPIHIGERTLGCVICHKTFSPESDPVGDECTSEPSQLCDDDGLAGGYQIPAGFNPKHQLHVPIRLHTGLKPFGCSVCGRTFAERESLRSHVTCHTAEKPFSCSVCNTGCSDSEDLVQHMRVHTRQTQFSCTVCGKEFAWRRHLEKHLEIHSRDKVYSCRYFQQRFSWHYQLKYHQCVGHQSLQLHQRPTEQMETEGNGEDIGGPEPDRNSRPEPATDDSVDSDFWKETREPQSGLYSLKGSEISDTIMECHAVNKDVGASESSHSVDSDIWKDNSPNGDKVPQSETRFTVTKPYTCSECGKRFHHNYNLRNHIKYHTGEKAFFCSICGLKCLYKSHLEIHMRTHTREKPFPCSVCGKRYAHKASMQSHMAVHTVEKQYVCGACGRGFAWYTELKYHQCASESLAGGKPCDQA